MPISYTAILKTIDNHIISRVGDIERKMQAAATRTDEKI